MQQALFPSVEKAGADVLMVLLKGLDVDLSVHVQFFEEDSSTGDFDQLRKTSAHELSRDANTFTIDKRDVASHRGGIFKLFCTTDANSRQRVYQLLCENGYTVNGPGHEDQASPGKWLIWFLTSQEPVNFASGNVGTINQILTSRAYPRVKDKAHKK